MQVSVTIWDRVDRESRTLLMLELHPSDGTKVEEISETGSSPSRHIP